MSLPNLPLGITLTRLLNYRASGVCRLRAQAIDLAIVPEATGRYTRRNALVEYSYGTGGAKTGTQEWYFVVRHVDRFPAVVP